MKTICVTGCNGYMGLALSVRLVDLGYRVVGIGTAPVRSVDLAPEVAYEAVDVRDTARLTQIFKEYEVEAVYHLAGIKYVGKCESNPEECFAVNTGGTESVLEAMKQTGVPKIIFASTYAVYAWEGDLVNLTEHTKTEPKTVYGQSKLKAEQAIEKAHQGGSLPQYQILRFGNVIGATKEVTLKAAASFIDKLVQTARVGGETTLSGSTYNTKDGTSARDYIDIKDVIDLMAACVGEGESGVFNVSSGEATTLKAVVEILEGITGKKVTCHYQERNPSDPSVIVIENTKAREALVWSPRVSMAETISFLVERAEY